MKVSIIEDPDIEDVEIHILCRKKNEYVSLIADRLKDTYVDIGGTKDSEYYKLSSKDIYYFESVDNKTFIYSQSTVYESELRLYELEEKLRDTRFARINKACVMNLEKLQRVKGQINGRLLATMTNGEQLIINRSYVADVKRKFGI